VKDSAFTFDPVNSDGSGREELAQFSGIVKTGLNAFDSTAALAG
jgi:hypothetical protein